MSWFLLAMLLFLFNAARLADRERMAAEDRRRAESESVHSIRLAEAWVAARHAYSRHDEAELIHVRAVDGGRPLPQRVLLSLSPRRRAPGARAGHEQSMSVPEAVPTRADALLQAGRWVRLALRVTPLYGRRNPGGREIERVQARYGFGARASLADPAWVVEIVTSLGGMRSERGIEVVGSGQRGPLFWFHQATSIRDQARGRVAARLRDLGDGSGFGRALALGQRGGMPEEVVEAFRKLGISHLLAVSGLHVGLVGGLAAWIFRRGLLVRIRPGFSPVTAVLWLSAGVAMTYAWVSGASVSAQRAGLGILFVFGLLSLRRSIRPAELLAGVGALLLAVEPARAFELGMRLSFAACLGLVAAGIWTDEPQAEIRTIERTGEVVPHLTSPSWSAALRDFFVMSIRVSLAAGLATTPVLAASGIAGAFWSPVANLVAMPLTGLFILPGSLVCVAFEWLNMTFFGDVAIDSIQGVQRGFFFSVENLVRAAVAIAERLPEKVETGWASPPMVWILAGCGVWRLRRTRGFPGRLAGSCLCWVALHFFVGSSPVISPSLMMDRSQVWFFDVGQGDAALIRTQEGSILVDTGRGSPNGQGGAALLRTLKRLGVRRLDLLILTHADLDHRGGAERLLESMPVREVWLPGGGGLDEGFDGVMRVAEKKGVVVQEAEASSESVTRAGLQLTVLWPPGRHPISHDSPARRSIGRDRNARSLVLRADIEGKRLLFMADVGQAEEARLLETRRADLQADLLKVTHHGSRDGSRGDFLAAVAASHAVVSAPCTRRWGLPNGETLDRIRATGSQVWWTGRDGAVYALLDSEKSGAFSGRELVPISMQHWGEKRNCGM